MAAAACFLPLSMNPVLSTQLGTRHRAGIGITEETDAIAVIVSEESGAISMAVGRKNRARFDCGTIAGGAEWRIAKIHVAGGDANDGLPNDESDAGKESALRASAQRC